MAIHSTYLGSVKLDGDEAKAFSQKLTHARGSRAASVSAASGRKLVATFAKTGTVTIKLRKPATKVNLNLKKSAAK